jgi:hypothetical protein
MDRDHNFLDRRVLDRDWLLFLAIVGLCIGLASARIVMAFM